MRAICTASPCANLGKSGAASRHIKVTRRHLMRRSRSRLRARASRAARQSRRMTSCRSEHRWPTALDILETTSRHAGSEGVDSPPL